MAKYKFEIVEISSGKVEHAALAPENERMREKLERWLLLKTDLDRYVVREVVDMDGDL